MCQNNYDKIEELINKNRLGQNSRVANKPNFPKPEKKIITTRAVEKSETSNDKS